MSLGNDLVCLATVGQMGRLRQQRFLDKVCVAAEQRLLRQTVAPEASLWWLWSLKEAAYKYSQRLQPDLPFRPTQYTLLEPIDLPKIVNTRTWVSKGFDLPTATGTYLQTPIGSVWGASVRTSHCLMSVVAASSQHLQTVRWGIVPIGTDHRETQSSEVRRVVAEHYRAYHHLPAHTSLTFGKAGQNAAGAGWPTLQINYQTQPCLLSFSHDGPYVAYALLDEPESLCTSNALFS
jgi:hypothetical protein